MLGVLKAGGMADLMGDDRAQDLQRVATRARAKGVMGFNLMEAPDPDSTAAEFGMAARIGRGHGEHEWSRARLDVALMPEVEADLHGAHSQR